MTAASETAILDLLDREFEVRPDGTIWRIGQRTRAGRVVAVLPRRADPVGSGGYRWVRVAVSTVDYVAPAHRIVWRAMFGLIPSGLEPNHRNGDRGDNRPVNLELLTKGENLAHAYRELGRVRMTGERNGRSVLSVSQVCAIRSRRAAGEGCSALAREFGVTRRTVRLIGLGLAWREVSGV